MFPHVRMQRMRINQKMRDMLAEIRLHKNDLIAPLFIKEGTTQKTEIRSMPGVHQHSLDSLKEEIDLISAAGIPAVLLFGIPALKSPLGESCYHSNGIIQQAIKVIKQQAPHLILIADCCLCEYTSHGHCGVMEEGRLNNDKTLVLLQETALSYAHAGVDIIAPSGMMDGMVGSIRTALDRQGFPMVSILSYAVKYASSLYGPFREAGGAGDVFKGDRKHHQMAPSQRKEARREVQQDVNEGADMVMVKPAMMYLDIIQQISSEFSTPVVAYQVSGEYAMLKAGAHARAFDEEAAFTESLLGMKRAGAGLIITYYAKQMAKIIGRNP